MLVPRRKEPAATVRAANEQRIEVPHPNNWFEFAHELDGYRIAEELGVDLPGLHFEQGEAYRTDGRFSGSLLELRLALFFEARASRFVGGLEVAGPHAEGGGHFQATDLYEMPEFRTEIASLLNSIAAAEDEVRQGDARDHGANHLPDSLELGIGGYLGPSYAVSWENGRLVYVGREPSRERLSSEEPVVIRRFVRPTERRWRGFWRSLDDIGFWGWQGSYHLDVLDGTQWSACIGREGVTIESRGSNGYPGGEEGKEFKAFLAAIRRLLGGLPFA